MEAKREKHLKAGGFSALLESKIVDRKDLVKKVQEAALNAMAELSAMEYLNCSDRSDLVDIDYLPSFEYFITVIEAAELKQQLQKWNP